MDQEQIVKGALDALEFAEGAILDAITCEDSLDGATGLAVLKMIWEQLELHGRSRTTTEEIVDWLEGQCKVDAPQHPISVQNRELVAKVERLQEDLAELLEDAFCQLAHKEKQGDRQGWWDTCARTTAMIQGDRLVELGLWEKHPTGYGRRWWYRPVKRKAAEGE